MTLSRIWPTFARPLVVAGLDDRLADLGFFIAGPATFSKLYHSPKSSLRIDAICGADEVYDLVGHLVIRSEANPTLELLKAEGIASLNSDTLTSLSMIRTAAGIGMPGGMSGVHNLNLPTDQPGPRWWPADLQAEDIEELQKWIRKQYRYNPEYSTMGDSMNQEGDGWHPAGKVPGNASYVSMGRDRQEPQLTYTMPDGTIGHKSLKGTEYEGSGGTGRGDLAQEMGKYQMRMKPDGQGNSTVYLNKKDTRGDQKGIWSINGPSAMPGFAFVWDDLRAGWGFHPEFLNDPEMTSGKWMPGTQRFQKYQ